MVNREKKVSSSIESEEKPNPLLWLIAIPMTIIVFPFSILRWFLVYPFLGIYLLARYVLTRFLLSDDMLEAFQETSENTLESYIKKRREKRRVRAQIWENFNDS